MLFWDILLVGAIAIATYYGHVTMPAAIMLAVIVLLPTAFSISFSTARFVFGIAFRLLALGIAISNQQMTTADSSRESAVPNAASSTTAKVRSSGDAVAASPPRRRFNEPPLPSFPRGMDCGWYRVQPGFSCAGRSQGARFPDYAPPPMFDARRPPHPTVETHRAAPHAPRERYYRDWDRLPPRWSLEI
jgi:hypothetical protein